MSRAHRSPPALGAALPFVLPRFTGMSLAPGLAVRAARWGSRPTVAAAVLFPGAGSTADPPGRDGTADVTGDTFLGGTRTKSARQLAEALDDLAAVAEVSAGSDSSVARLYVLEQDLDEGLALLAEILTEATFPEDEFEKSRRRHIATLQEQRSEPDFLARERLYDRLYPGHPYGKVSPTEKGLESLTREDVAGFARRRFAALGRHARPRGRGGPGRASRGGRPRLRPPVRGGPGACARDPAAARDPGLFDPPRPPARLRPDEPPLRAPRDRAPAPAFPGRRRLEPIARRRGVVPPVPRPQGRKGPHLRRVLVARGACPRRALRRVDRLPDRSYR